LVPSRFRGADRLKTDEHPGAVAGGEWFVVGLQLLVAIQCPLALTAGGSCAGDESLDCCLETASCLVLDRLPYGPLNV
jgi:hypothetical protein